jgi:hypothetical protein
MDIAKTIRIIMNLMRLVQNSIFDSKYRSFNYVLLFISSYSQNISPKPYPVPGYINSFVKYSGIPRKSPTIVIIVLILPIKSQLIICFLEFLILD